MLYGALSLALTAIFVRKGLSQACTGDREADLTAIEFQIPMNPGAFRGEVKLQLEEFLDYLDETLEDQSFLDILDIKKGSAECWARRDRTITAINNNRMANDAPGESSIKYRQSVEFPDCNDKCQNDISYQFRHGDECENFAVGGAYAHIFEEKVEANIGPDSCVQYSMQGQDIYSGMGYTAKIEFDDDEMFEDCVDFPAEDILSDMDLMKWPTDCLGSGMETYFPGKCLWYSVPADFTREFKDVYNIVMDVDFEFNADKDMDGDLETVCEGKFTFQIRFDSEAELMDEDPTARETELSVKIKKDDADDGWWDFCVETAKDVVDQIAGCGHPWIRYSGCSFADVKLDDCKTKRPTMSPTHSPGYMPDPCCQARPGARRRWNNVCESQMDEVSCTDTRKKSRNCQWVPCV